MLARLLNWAFSGILRIVSLKAGGKYLLFFDPRSLDVNRLLSIEGHAGISIEAIPVLPMFGQPIEKCMEFVECQGK